MDKDLLYRFFEGHASLEDMKVVKEWADASEENAGLCVGNANCLMP